MKLVLLLTILLGVTFAAVSDDSDTYKKLFDSESDFMKGFETGILLRSKNGKPDDFGCQLPNNLN